MIKKLIIIFFVCSVIFWGLTRHLSYPPNQSTVANTPKKTKIKNEEIKPTVAPTNKLNLNEIKIPKDTQIVEIDHVTTDAIKTNAISESDHTYSEKNDIHDINILQSDAATSFTSNIKFNWDSVKLSAMTTLTNHADNAQQETISSPEAVNDTQTDKVRCPLVEKIQQAAQQINEAFFYDGAYMLSTSGPAFQDNDLTWLIAVKGIVADSSDEAIYKAIIVASQVNQVKIEYAQIPEKFEAPFTIYCCYYEPGDIYVAGIRNEELAHWNQE